MHNCYPFFFIFGHTSESTISSFKYNLKSIIMGKSLLESNNENADNQFEESLIKWISDEKIGFEFAEVLNRLFYDKSVELILFRSQLLDRSASVILYKHSYAETVIGKKLDVKDSLDIAKAIADLDIVLPNLPD